MIKPVGVLRQIQFEGRFIEPAIVDAGQIPGGIIDGETIAADGWVEDFEHLSKKPDGAVFVDPATTLHHEKRFDIGDLGYRLTHR